MTIQSTDQMPDDLNDELGRLLRGAKTIPAWTKEKRQLLDRCFELAISIGYFQFTSDFRRYYLEHKGAHCLYRVPHGQRGALSKFVGQRVRLICLGKSDGRAGRFFLVGAI